MGGRAPRRLPEKRRAELLEAARDVLRERPRAVIGEVAARAGVAKGTFYLYFTSKEELLEALREKRVRGTLDWARCRLGEVGTADWEARIAVLAEATVELFWRELDLHEATFHATPAAGRAHDRALREFAEFWERFIREGVAAGGLVCRDPELTAAALIQAAHGAVDHAIEEGLERARPVACTVELARRALAR